MANASGVAEFHLGAILSLELIFYFSVFFTLGYFLYSVFFAAIAATCTSTEELGQAMFAAIMPMVIALMSTFYVIANPGTAATRVLSLLPPLTPLVMLARVNVLPPPAWEVWLGIVMLARVNVLPPPAWEVCLGIVLLGLAIVVTGWLAAKTFRYALLLHGKRPTLPELLSVIRAS